MINDKRKDNNEYFFFNYLSFHIFLVYLLNNKNLYSMYFSMINNEVMTDTVQQYQSNPVLKEAVCSSIERQYMVAEEDNIDLPKAEASTTKYIVSGKRSFEAAKCYPAKKVAVLNFANNHSIGGSPFSAGAQEESLCRCSTLYPCLQAAQIMPAHSVAILSSLAISGK